MTKEEVIEILERFVFGAKPCSQKEIVDACVSAYRMLKEQPSLPSNLDEAAKEYNRNYTPFDQCDSRDIIRTFKAGAEWLAGQFFPRWRNINEDKPKQGEGCACIIVTVNGRIKYSNFEDGPWFWSEKIDDELLGETEAFIGHNFYGDKEYHTCSHWMPWDEFMGALERMLKK